MGYETARRLDTSSRPRALLRCGTARKQMWQVAAQRSNTMLRPASELRNLMERERQRRHENRSQFLYVVLLY